jgi:hypothetical protein
MDVQKDVRELDHQLVLIVIIYAVTVVSKCLNAVIQIYVIQINNTYANLAKTMALSKYVFNATLTLLPNKIYNICLYVHYIYIVTPSDQNQGFVTLKGISI